MGIARGWGADYFPNFGGVTSLRVLGNRIWPTCGLCDVGINFEDLHEKDLHEIGSMREWHSLVVILQHSFAAAPFNTSVVASVVHLTVALSATEVV